MIKALWAVSRNPRVSLAECQQHWFEVHGQHHISSGHKLRGYIQHHTLAHAYDGTPAPTHDGVSIVWLRDVDNYKEAMNSPAWAAASRDGRGGVHGGRALFQYPLVFSLAQERVVLDGPTSPSMVKAIYVVRRNPGIDTEAFQAHWFEVHGRLCAQVPGLRRYVQNHGLEAGRAFSPDCHDGWYELWFDDLDALRAAVGTEQWLATRNDARCGWRGEALFERGQTCLVIGRERPLLQPAIL